MLRSGTLPDAGGTPVTVLIRTTERDFDEPDGVAVTEHGQILSMAQVWELLDEAELVAVGYDLTGAVKDCARQQRRASRAQRRALASRDGGCCFPGCTDRRPGARPITSGSGPRAARRHWTTVLVVRSTIDISPGSAGP